MNKKLKKVLLILIIAIAASVRLYKLDTYPPSITWDEASVGYNAYTILHWGKDEWGRILPLTFKSFGDDKNPMHVYLTVPFVLIFGLNDYSVRLSAAFFGILNVYAIYLFSKKLFKKEGVGLISSFFLAVSPFAIQFSRFNHELNFAIFFALMGFYFFLRGLEEKKYLIYSFIFLGLDLLVYQSAKVVTPPLVLMMIVLNIKKLLKFKREFAIGLAIYAFFVSLLFIKPELLGTARLNQTKIPEDEIQENGGMVNTIVNRYGLYFQPQFLFVSGDENPRHSTQVVGEFYWFDLSFMAIGLIAILWQIFSKKDWNLALLPAMLFLAPLPGVVSSTTPHASRAMFMLPSLITISSYGAYILVTFLKNKYYRYAAAVLLVLLVTPFFYRYIKNYFTEYPRKYAIEWIYGMKEIADYVEENQEDLYRVYVTDVRMQPYIFFLYYFKIPLPEYLDSVKYNETETKSYSLVNSFGPFGFIWDQIYSEPIDGTLYAVTSDIYDGLFRKNDFEVKKLIKYPDGTDAFYLLSPK